MKSPHPPTHPPLGLSEAEWEFVRARLIEPLNQAGCTVWAFGSRARGDNQRFSDLDILVEHPSLELSALLGELRELLVNSSFPYKLDLVDKKHFARDYLQNFENEKTKLT
jgi:predicted nucleotidyltransferase